MSEERRVHEERVIECQQRLRNSASPEMLDAAALGGSLMFLGRLREALDAFWLANQLGESRPVGARSKGTYYSTIGTLYWLMEDRTKAIEIWRAYCDGILDGTVCYADYPGGAHEGLLLWYGAVTQADQQQLAFAHAYLRRLGTNNSRITSWPGPLVLYVLGEYSREQVLLATQGATKRLGRLIAMSRSHVLLRRRLVNALFCFGVYHRANREDDECKRMFQLCASLENPEVEDEWYLARHELGLPILADP